MPDVNTLLIQCPSCGGRQLSRSAAGNDIPHQRIYSDNKRIVPMRQDTPEYTICPLCGAFYRVRDDVAGALAVQAEQAALPYIRHLTAQEYCRALQTGLCNCADPGSIEWEVDILSMRFYLWHIFNDRFRDREPQLKTMDFDDDTKRVYEENCNELIKGMYIYKILKTMHDSFTILQAELCRNLGDFEACKGYLSSVYFPGDYHLKIEAISNACDNAVTRTILYEF